MADENTETTTTENVAVADHEGNLREGWRDGLPEDMRSEQCLDLIGDNIYEAIKQTVHAQKNVGKNKVPIPGEAGTKADWDAFYTAGGKPKTAGDYAYAPPEEGFKLPAEEVKGLQDFFHELGLSAWQGKKVMTRLHDGGAQAELDKEAALVTESEEAETALKKIWGMEYSNRVQTANILLEQTNTDRPERKAKMIAEFGRNPLFVEWAADAGADLLEHEELVASLQQTAPKEASRELLELQGSDDYQQFLSGELKQKNLAKHNRIQQKENELYDIIHPEG